MCINLLNASSNRLWCILIYFMWIDIMLYSWISVDLKNTIYKQNFRKFDYLISNSKWQSVTMATLHWPIKSSVFWFYIVCLFLWCIGNTYTITLNFYFYEYHSPWARYEPPPPLRIFEDSDFWTPCYMTIQYLLVCTQNIRGIKNTVSSNICTLLNFER